MFKLSTCELKKYLNSAGDPEFQIGAQANDESDEVELLVHGTVGDPWLKLDSLSVAEYLNDNRDKTVHVRPLRVTRHRLPRSLHKALIQSPCTPTRSL